jgi:hypothetical protein
VKLEVIFASVSSQIRDRRRDDRSNIVWVSDWGLLARRHSACCRNIYMYVSQDSKSRRQCVEAAFYEQGSRALNAR